MLSASTRAFGQHAPGGIFIGRDQKLASSQPAQRFQTLHKLAGRGINGGFALYRRLGQFRQQWKSLQHLAVRAVAVAEKLHVAQISQPINVRHPAIGIEVQPVIQRAMLVVEQQVSHHVSVQGHLVSHRQLFFNHQHKAIQRAIPSTHRDQGRVKAPLHWHREAYRMLYLASQRGGIEIGRKIEASREQNTLAALTSLPAPDEILQTDIRGRRLRSFVRRKLLSSGLSEKNRLVDGSYYIAVFQESRAERDETGTAREDRFSVSSLVLAGNRRPNPPF